MLAKAKLAQTQNQEDGPLIPKHASKGDFFFLSIKKEVAA